MVPGCQVLISPLGRDTSSRSFSWSTGHVGGLPGREETRHAVGNGEVAVKPFEVPERVQELAEEFWYPERVLVEVRGSDDSKHAVSVQGHAYVQLIGWQNTWEQAPGVPATPSPP